MKYNTFKKGAFATLLLLIGMLVSTANFTLAASPAAPAAVSLNSLNTGNSAWFWQNPLPQGNSLSAIDCAIVSAADFCLAVGTASTIISTSNGGVDWTDRPAPSSGINLNDIACATSNNDTCVTVGTEGKIFRTSNSGSTWTLGVLGTATTNEFVGAGCSGTVTCFAVGVGGIIYKTGDAGVNWTAQTSGTTNRLNDIACSGPVTCVAVSSSGTIRRTVNGGTNWAVASNIAAIGSTFLASVDCFGATCYTVGEDGKIFKSTDSGDVWAGPQTNNDTGGAPNSDLSRVTCISATVCYASGNGGTVIKTTDGSNWNEAATGSTANVGISNPLPGLSCASSTNCYAVGSQGTIVKTTNGGTSATWSEISSGNTSSIMSMSCPDVDTCYGGSGSQLLFKTTNGGDTWTTTTLSPSGLSGNESLAGISCLAANNCYIATGSGHIVRLTNGTTATTDDTSASTFYRGISCASGLACMAVGPSGKVRLTTNAPGNWTNTADTQTDNFNGVSCVPGSTPVCYLVSNEGHIFKTTDAGNNIDLVFTHPAAKSFSAIDCFNNQVCVVVGATDTGNPTDSANIYRTTDGGQNWEPQSTTRVGILGANHPNLTSVSCITATTCYAAGEQGFTAIVDNAITKNGSPARVHWQAINSGTSLTLSAISCVVGCTVGGSNGAILGNFIRVTTTAALLTQLPNVGAGQALVISNSGSQTLASNLDLTSKVHFVIGGKCGASGPALTLNYSGAGPELNLGIGDTVVGLGFNFTGTGTAALKSTSSNTGNSLFCVKVT